MFGRTRSLVRAGDAARDARDWPEAQAAYAAVVQRRPKLSAIWVQYGHALRETGQLQQALAAYRRAEAIRPEIADTHHQIGRTLTRLGDTAAALESYERAIALDRSRQDFVREAAGLRAAIQRRGTSAQELAPGILRYVNLGTTGLCNASCVHCPTGKTSTAHVPRTPMPMDLFKKIIDGIAEAGLLVTDQIAFGLFGDGLVDPFVVQRADYLRATLPSAPLSINTNGAAFNKARHAPLRELASTIALHCESLDPPTYDDLMRPLRAERVIPKIEEILETFTHQVVVSVPVNKRNLDELPSIKKWFLERGARDVVFDPLSSRCAEDRTLFESLALNPQPIRCSPEIIDDLVVDCDGQVLLCCQDFRREEAIGNLRTESLTEVLTGLRRRNALKILAENRHEELATCSKCYADVRAA